MTSRFSAVKWFSCFLITAQIVTPTNACHSELFLCANPNTRDTNQYFYDTFNWFLYILIISSLLSNTFRLNDDNNKRSSSSKNNIKSSINQQYKWEYFGKFDCFFICSIWYCKHQQFNELYVFSSLLFVFCLQEPHQTFCWRGKHHLIRT